MRVRKSKRRNRRSTCSARSTSFLEGVEQEAVAAHKITELNSELFKAEIDKAKAQTRYEQIEMVLRKRSDNRRDQLVQSGCCRLKYLSSSLDSNASRPGDPGFRTTGGTVGQIRSASSQNGSNASGATRSSRSDPTGSSKDLRLGQTRV